MDSTWMWWMCWRSQTEQTGRKNAQIFGMHPEVHRAQNLSKSSMLCWAKPEAKQCSLVSLLPLAGTASTGTLAFATDTVFTAANFVNSCDVSLWCVKVAVLDCKHFRPVHVRWMHLAAISYLQGETVVRAQSFDVMLRYAASWELGGQCCSSLLNLLSKDVYSACNCNFALQLKMPAPFFLVLENCVLKQRDLKLGWISLLNLTASSSWSIRFLKRLFSLQCIDYFFGKLCERTSIWYLLHQCFLC